MRGADAQVQPVFFAQLLARRADSVIVEAFSAATLGGESLCETPALEPRVAMNVGEVIEVLAAHFARQRAAAPHL
ncbi:MAG: hypothetical protein ACREUU_07360 [Gammaproteobacteria bacterium]